MNWINNFTIEKPRKRLKDLGTNEYSISYLENSGNPPKALMILLGNKFYHYKLIEQKEN